MNILQPSQWTPSTDPNNNELSVGGATYFVQNAGQSWSLTSPAANTLRFEVRPGDVWSAVDPSSKERSEIAGTTTYGNDTQINISYNFEVEPGATNNASWLVAGQLHQTASDGWSPPFEIDFNGGDQMSISVNEAGNSANSWSQYHTIYTDPNNIVRGHTYSMQIIADFDPVNGHLEVIRDGVVLVDYHGALGYSGMGQVYWKEGVYRAAASTDIAMDYSNLSVTTGSTSTSTGSGSTSTGSGSTSTGSGSGSTSTGSGSTSTGSGSTSTSTGSSSTYTGTAATISSSLDSLNGNTSVSKIVISDNAAVTLSATQLQNDSHALSELQNANGSTYHLAVADTGAHISAALSALAANSHVSSINVTDGAMVTVSSSQYAADTAVLNKISGAHTVEITGYTGTGYTAQDLTYDAKGVLAERTYHNTDGSLSITGLESGLAFSSSAQKQSITVSNSGDWFTYNTQSTTETITGYQAGKDGLVINHLLAASASAVLADAHSDGHGGTLINFGSGHTIDLVGVSVSTLQQHTADFTFF